MNEAKTIVKSYWDQQSSTFDMSPGHVASSKREEDAWKALLQEKIGSREKMVLDIGVGTGFLSIMLAEMGYNVVGIDLSEAMIKIARKKIDDRDLKIRLELVDAESLSFEDESFDAIVNRNVLSQLPDPRKALSEWKRVLKPNGTLCFFLNGPHSRGLFYRSKKQFINLSSIGREKRNPLKSLYNSLNLPLHGGIDPSAVTNLLKKAGYIDVSSDHLTEIGRIKSENMPWYHRISSQKSERYCYHCRKSKR
jgi:ubiquinone/menaquinone biosynthesis C-methylase UbiE